MAETPDRHIDDAAFHVANAVAALERARAAAENPAQHALYWRLEHAARNLHVRVRQAVRRLAQLRRAA